MGEMGHAYEILVGIFEVKSQHCRPGRRQDRERVTETGCDGVGWIQLAEVCSNPRGSVR